MKGAELLQQWNLDREDGIYNQYPYHDQWGRGIQHMMEMV
jgi:hypothetical protein